MAESKFNTILNRLKLSLGLVAFARYTVIFVSVLFMVFILMLHVYKAAGNKYIGEYGIVLFVVMGLLYLVLTFLRIRFLIRPAKRQFARYAESSMPEMSTSISHAVELSDSLQPGASSELATWYETAAAQKLEMAAKKISIATELKFASVFIVVAVLFLVSIFSFHSALLDGWKQMFTSSRRFAEVVEPVKTSSDSIKVAVVVGNIQVRYDYPRYTSIPSRTDSNTVGRIKALKGTTVSFSARLSEDVRSIQAKFAEGEAIAVEKKNTDISFRMTVLRNDALEIKAVSNTGIEHIVFRDTIISEPDLSPSVDVVSEKPVDAVRKRDVLQLSVRASDDFGLSLLQLLLVQGNRENSERINVSKGAVSCNESIEFDLSRYDISDNENVFIVAEVVDNDAVSGFKRVRSAPIPLVFVDEKKVKEEYEARLKDFEKRALGLLADHLEAGFSENEPADKIRSKSNFFDTGTYALLQMVSLMLADMQYSDDVMSDDIYGVLETFVAKLGVAADNRRGMAERFRRETYNLLVKAQEAEIRELEDVIIKLDDLSSVEEISEVMDMMEELNKRGDDLAKKLDDMQQPEKLDELQKEYAKLQKELMNLLEKLMNRDKNSGLPEEFLNDDGLKNLPADELSETLKNIQDALKSGDTKRAEAEMAKLRDLMDQMASAVASAESNYYNEEHEKRMDAMRNMMKELDKLIDRQARLNADGEKELERELPPSDSALMESIKKMASEQGSILNKMETMAKGLEGMMEGMTGEDGSGAGMEGDMEGALSGLGSSFSQMSRNNLGGSIPSAQKGLYHMMRLKEGMKQSMSGMGKNRMGAGSGQGFPGGSRSGRSGRRGGKQGTATGRIELVPENKQGKIRDLIKDAIKEDGPREYQNENRKYYEQLGN